MGYYSSLKRNAEVLTHDPACTINGVNLENTFLSEISQTQKDKYCRIPFICLDEANS